MSRCEIIVSGEQMEVTASDDNLLVTKEALLDSYEFEAVMSDNSTGSKRTRS